MTVDETVELSLSDERAGATTDGRAARVVFVLAVCLYVASVAPLLLLCRELRLGAWETNLALALAAVNGYLIKYAQEVRMYSLLLLLTLCSLWLFARFLNAAEARRAR